jgi:DNA-binding protein HU-beta
MIRSELVDAIHRSHGGISRAEAQDLLDLILDLIKSRLGAGEKVDIPGFGSFEIVASLPREGRHPVTGRRFRVAAGRSLVFRPSRKLQDELSSTPAPEDAA